MSILILSIICFILAFIPFLKTMIATILVGVSTIVLAIIYERKQKGDIKEKNKRELPIIAIIISVMAMVISIVNFGISLEFNEEPIDSLKIRINSFENYSMMDEVVVDNMIKLQVKDVSFDGNKCLVKIQATGLGNNIKLSLNDFFVYNEKTNEVSFAKDSASDNITFYSKINKDEILEDCIVFELEKMENIEEIYLVYKNDVNSVKFKL